MKDALQWKGCRASLLFGKIEWTERSSEDLSKSLAKREERKPLRAYGYREMIQGRAKPDQREPMLALAGIEVRPSC